MVPPCADSPGLMVSIKPGTRQSMVVCEMQLVIGGTVGPRPTKERIAGAVEQKRPFWPHALRQKRMSAGSKARPCRMRLTERAKGSRVPACVRRYFWGRFCA